jgi:hypothetical protein
MMLRGDGRINPDGVRDYDLMVPASVEALTIERHAAERDSWAVAADDWREEYRRAHPARAEAAP